MTALAVLLRMTLPFLIVTLAPLPSASISFALLTLSAMTRLPLDVASKMLALTMAFPVEMVSGEVLLALTMVLLTSVRCASPAPIVPAPEMVFLRLISVAPLLTARMKASLPPMITLPPPCSVALDKPTRSTAETAVGASTSMAPELLIVPLIVSVAKSSISTTEPPAMVTPLIVLSVPKTASIFAPLPTVLSVPPETTAPLRSTCAPEPEAKIDPEPILVTVPSKITLAPLPIASMIFELATSLSMARPTEFVPSSVPELMTTLPGVAMVKGMKNVPLPLITPLAPLMS
jgi:hypothetical protein